MSTCLIFLFAALVEFALVNSLARGSKDISETNGNSTTETPVRTIPFGNLFCNSSIYAVWCYYNSFNKLQAYETSNCIKAMIVKKYNFYVN